MPRTPLLLATLGLLAAAPAVAGPPWISIEYPANPHHASTRGAALLVRAYHHSTAHSVPVRGSAEGIVNGKRVSRQLELRPTNIAGVYALRSELPGEGTWVLAISLEQGTNDGATALVTLDGKGGIAHVEVPATRNAEGWTVPRQVRPADVERALQLAVAGVPGGSGYSHAGAGAGAFLDGRFMLAGMLALPLMLGLVVRRRQQSR
jgi:hypothetical protein